MVFFFSSRAGHSSTKCCSFSGPPLQSLHVGSTSCELNFALLACSLSVPVKPKSDIHCNRSATSPRPKFKTIAEESQLGFAVGRRLVGDWSATNRGLVAE